MIIRDTCLMVATYCSFVCFQVTADWNSNSNVGGGVEQPVLSNSSPSLTEDWHEEKGWPDSRVRVGQVGGVAVSKRGELVVFHRGDHVWGQSTFDLREVYTEQGRGPIPTSTVLVLHPDTGALLQEWGEHMFYLPHGITIDQEENVWLTDVAMHQVFKFPPLSSKNNRTPLLTLGKMFTPGNSAVMFCKPTSVAVTPWGDFFVADGYCNSRLIKFNKAGEKILEIGHATFTFGIGMPDVYSFRVPHALTLAEDRNLVCVADRENGRVLCYDWNNGTFMFYISDRQIGSLIYSVAYSPLNGGLFFVVNGARFEFNAPPVRGYVISASNLRLLSYFGTGLQMPHDLAMSADAKHVYVGEIGPNKVHKYSHNGTVGLVPASTTIPHTDDTKVLEPPQPLETPDNEADLSDMDWPIVIAM